MSSCYSCATISQYTEFCPTCGRAYKSSATEESLAQSEQRNLDQQIYLRSQLQSQADWYQNQISALRDFQAAKQNLKEKPRKRNMDYSDEQYEAAYQDSRYFKSGRRCKGHDEYECDDCAQRSIKMHSGLSLLPAMMAQPKSFQSVDKIQMREEFEDQTEFVKKALNLDEEQMNKIKVKDLGKKLGEAKEQITVGQMKDLIKERIKMPGFLQSIFSWVFHIKIQ